MNFNLSQSRKYLIYFWLYTRTASLEGDSGSTTATYASQDGDWRHHESHRAGLRIGGAQENIEPVKASCLLVDGWDRGPS